MTLALVDMTSATCLSCSVLLSVCVPDLTVAAAVVASDENSVVTSATPEPPAGALGGMGVEPKPTYLPPWLGGRWSGRAAFSCEREIGRA
jgi:hypothetical protein